MRKYPVQKSTAQTETTETAELSATAVLDDEDSVAELAYRLWTERGRPEGSPEEDWFRAQDLLRSGRAVMSSSALP